MRLIDADAFDECLKNAEIEATKERRYVFSSAINTIRGNLANAPTIESQIIRCKDCKWWGRKDTYKDGSSATVCKKGRSISEEGFCHYAERRTDTDMRGGEE